MNLTDSQRDLLRAFVALQVEGFGDGFKLEQATNLMGSYPYESADDCVALLEAEALRVVWCPSTLRDRPDQLVREPLSRFTPTRVGVLGILT